MLFESSCVQSKIIFAAAATLLLGLTGMRMGDSFSTPFNRGAQVRFLKRVVRGRPFGAAEVAAEWQVQGGGDAQASGPGTNLAVPGVGNGKMQSQDLAKKSQRPTPAAPGSDKQTKQTKNKSKSKSKNKGNTRPPPVLPLLAALATPRGSGGVGGVDSALRDVPELDNIAVVMIGGTNRSEWARAAHDTWLQMFSNRMYVTDVEPTEKDLGRDLADIAVNVFDGYPTDDAQIERFIHAKHPFRRHMKQQKEGQTHKLGWQLAQPRYLLGLEALTKKFPNADWYFVADSDTFVFPRRLQRGLLTQYPAQKRAVALGTRWQKRVGKGELEPCLLGGSGTVISAEAIRQVNVSDCVEKQDSNPKWNKLASDWRVARCFNQAEVELKAVDFMWMVDQDFTCGPHGPADCGNFYSRVHRTRTQCPYSLHYVTPESTRSLFAAASSQVCLPADDGTCGCTVPSAAQA